MNTAAPLPWQKTTARSEVTCCGDGGRGGELVWLPDGRLQVTHYGNAQHSNERWRKLVHVRTGAVENVPDDEVPARAEPPTESPGPSGEKVTSTSTRGRLTVTLTTGRSRRTLLSVAAPSRTRSACLRGALTAVGSWSRTTSTDCFS